MVKWCATAMFVDGLIHQPPAITNQLAHNLASTTGLAKKSSSHRATDQGLELFAEILSLILQECAHQAAEAKDIELY